MTNVKIRAKSVRSNTCESAGVRLDGVRASRVRHVPLFYASTQDEEYFDVVEYGPTRVRAGLPCLAVDALEFQRRQEAFRYRVISALPTT
jgi:hypothetical protein